MTRVVLQWRKPLHPFPTQATQDAVGTGASEARLRAARQPYEKLRCLWKVGAPVVGNVQVRWRTKVEVGPRP